MMIMETSCYTFFLDGFKASFQPSGKPKFHLSELEIIKFS